MFSPAHLSSFAFLQLATYSHKNEGFFSLPIMLTNSAMIPVIAVSHADQRSYVDLVTEPTAGVLRSVGVSEGTNRHYANIIIDGRSVIDQVELNQYFHSSLNHGRGESNNGLFLNMDFSELRVQIKDGQARSPATRFWAAYELKEEELPEDRRNQFARETEDDDPDFEELATGSKTKSTADGYTYYTPAPDDRSESQILLGRSYGTYIELEKDVSRWDDTLTATVHYIDWKGEPTEERPEEEEPEMVFRFHGMQHVLDQVTPDLDESDTAVTFELSLSSVAPDIKAGVPIDLTVSTQFDTWANYGAAFRVY